MYDAKVIDPSQVADLRGELLGADGVPLVLPAAWYRGHTQEELALAGLRAGVYGWLSTELIDWLVWQIAGRSAIEIGAGHGGLARVLGIVATDNRMMEQPAIAAYYAAMRQPVTTYGANVVALDASAAVRQCQPQVVVACWVTHKYRADRHGAGGNQFGVDEEDVLANCEEYIFVGNTAIHAGKSIWNRQHTRLVPDWLFSRALNGTANFLCVWRGKKATTPIIVQPC